MTASEIKARIEAAEKKITAKQATIEKKTGWINSGKKDRFEVGYLKDDIARLTREIEETKGTIAKYAAQLAKTNKADEAHDRMPEIMRELEKRLATEWTAADIAEREALIAEYRKIGETFPRYTREAHEAYNAFYSTHRGFHNKAHRTDAEIEKEAKRDAAAYVLDLFQRVEQITGQITELYNITCEGVALNGFIVGKEGRAKVETILAGGYNIQRLHCRTLVHAYN